MNYYAGKLATCWHYDPENCEAVQAEEWTPPRSKQWVRERELEPCSHCHPHKRIERHKGESISNLAKSIKYGTERQTGD